MTILKLLEVPEVSSLLCKTVAEPSLSATKLWVRFGNGEQRLGNGEQRFGNRDKKFGTEEKTGSAI